MDQAGAEDIQAYLKSNLKRVNSFRKDNPNCDFCKDYKSYVLNQSNYHKKPPRYHFIIEKTSHDGQ